jgi:hypothetical protein
MTDAERHRRHMVKLRTRAAAREDNVTHDKPASWLSKKLEWKILVDDEGNGFISADMGPFELYVGQHFDNTFYWCVLKREDANKDATDVAEGGAPSLVAAMKAAEVAAFPHWLAEQAVKRG